MIFSLESCDSDLFSFCLAFLNMVRKGNHLKILNFQILTAGVIMTSNFTFYSVCVVN